MAREMKDSGIEWIGEIPRKWNINSLSQLFSQVKNKNIDLQETNLLSLSYGKIKRKNIETTDGLLPESFDGYNIIEANDIVLRLTDLQNDHKSLRVGLVTERGIITSAYLTIRNHSESSAKFLYYYLHAFDISKGFYGMGAGVRQGLNWDGIKWLKILSPTVQEQQSIADFLDSQCAHIDSVIEKTHAAVEEYKKLKQAVITQAVTKGIRPNREMKDSGIEWIGEIPTDWHFIISRFLIEQIGDVDHYMPVSVDNGIPYVMTGDLKKFISEINFEKCKKISKSDYDSLCVKIQPSVGDVIFARYATIGTVCYVDKDEKCVISYSCVTIKPNRKQLDGKFLFYYLQSSTFFEEVYQFINSNTQGNVGIEALYRIRIPKTTLLEQSEIVAYLDEKTDAIDSLIQKKEQLITELESYKKSLIYEYVTGKKEVPDNKIISISVEVQIALLICKILKSTEIKGRIHLQKVIYALDILLNLFEETQYYRFPHGPYDLQIEKYESILVNQGWVNISKTHGHIRYNKTDRFNDFEKLYLEVFKTNDTEIQNICSLFNVGRTSKAEKMATVLASWNDFLIDGVNPTDDMIINDIVTNWTANKANISVETWRVIIQQLKENQMIPKGYGKHTLKKEQNDYAH